MWAISRKPAADKGKDHLKIVTLWLNPTIDVSGEAELILPNH